MSYEIYWGAGNPYSWCVLLGLEIKRLKYKSRLLEFSKLEHRSPEILEMNPRGQLPILKDGDISIYESIAILAYLDSKHPEISLFGTTPEEIGYIWQRVFEVENYFRDKILGIVHPIFFDDVADNIDSIEKSVSYVKSEFKVLEGQLEKSKFLVGNNISAADVVLFPLVQALFRAMSMKSAGLLDLEFKQLKKYYPNIYSWKMRIESIPGYENTYPPSWKD